MKEKDVKNILVISDDERKKVQDYLGLRPARMNVLLDLEPYSVASLEKNGWSIYENLDELLGDFDTFLAVYSVMVKNSGEILDTLYRGASSEECKFFGKTTKKFSATTFEKDVGERFANQNEKPGLISYRIDGEIPYIDSADFLDGEKEIILPPFACINKFEYVGKEEGRSIYEAVISSSKNSLEFERKEELEKYIRENFESYRAFVEKVKKSEKVEFGEEYNEAYKFSKAVSDFITILCMERLLEVQTAKEVIENQKQELDKEYAEMMQENQRRAMIRGMQSRIQFVPAKTVDFFAKLEVLNRVIDTENEYVYHAEKLKIPYSRRLERHWVTGRVEKIKQAIDEMSTNISTAVITDEMTEEEAREEVAKIQDDLRSVEALGLDVAGIEYLPSIFKRQMDKNMKEQIDKRAFSVIKRLRIQKYKQDLQNIPEDPGIWARLTGKARIMSLQRENLRYRIELEGLKRHEPRRMYSILDTVSDLDVEMQLLRIRTPESQTFRDSVTAFYSVSEDSVKQEVEEKLAKTRNLPVNFDSKRVTNRRQVSFLQEVNSYLVDAIKAERGKTRKYIKENQMIDISLEQGSYISDTAMYELVNGILTNIENKTVNRGRDDTKDVMVSIPEIEEQK